MTKNDSDLKNAFQGLAIAAAISARESALLTCAFIAGESLVRNEVTDIDEKAGNVAIENLQNLHKFFKNI